jgi:hypothetical protein
MIGLFRGMACIACLLLVLGVKAQTKEVWNKYSVSRFVNTSSLDSARRIFRQKGKAGSLEDNISSFYLYINGELVRPPAKMKTEFFQAACLCFKFNDTLMLNSGLGSSMGLGVGIKIYRDKFTGTLHANSENKKIYKMNYKDKEYISDVQAIPLTQSLKLRRSPNFTSNEVMIGEYRATYKRIFQKKAKGKDQPKVYTVRLIFKCKITGIDTIRDETGLNSK